MTRLRTPPRTIRQQIQQLNEKAEGLEHQLLQSQRLATLGTMAMSMAHEFNNLLMTIINQADMALLREEPEAMRVALQKTMTCGEQAAVMIRNMLGHARGHSDQVEILDAAEAMEAALGLLGRHPEKDGIRLERQYEDGLMVRASRVDLAQVLLNLIINACQAMKPGSGVLTLRTRVVSKEVVLEVADTGCGISADHMARIFEPFFTTKTARDGGGTGLGLYLSRKLVEKHGGRMTLLTEQDQGTTFQLWMPRQ